MYPDIFFYSFKREVIHGADVSYKLLRENTFSILLKYYY
jgi:hypothetical protein